VNINNGSEKFRKITATVGELITTEYALVVYVYIFCRHYLGRLEYKSHLLDQGVGVWEAVRKNITLLLLLLLLLLFHHLCSLFFWLLTGTLY